MISASPFVVLVTGPSAGVGTSTLASNLAVYLKALEEELPVAYASLEAGADVDALFRLGAPSQYSLADLQQGMLFAQLFVLGQFGVDYCAAPAVGQRPAAPHALRQELAAATYPGVLVVDAAGANPFLAAALASADIVLVPVKDPAALGQLVRLQKALLASGGERGQLWLLPSQLGAESPYQPAASLPEFLRFAAQERGFQVLDELFCADPLVAERAVKLARPVLTRTPQSALHQQLKQLAALVLQQRQQQSSFAVRVRRLLQDGLLPPRAKRVALRCPLCQQPALSDAVHYLESFPARRRLLLHRHCVAALLAGTGAAAFSAAAGLTLVQAGALFGGENGQLRVQVVAEDGALLNTEMLPGAESSAWQVVLQTATGRGLAELYRELFIFSEPMPVAAVLTADWYRQFVARRRALRQACSQEQL